MADHRRMNTEKIAGKQKFSIIGIWKGMRVVGKIEKLENFKLEIYFQILVFNARWKQRRSFQLPFPTTIENERKIFIYI